MMHSIVTANNTFSHDSGEYSMQFFSIWERGGSDQLLFGDKTSNFLYQNACKDPKNQTVSQN